MDAVASGVNKRRTRR